MSKLKEYCFNITDGEHGSVKADLSGDFYFLNNNNITSNGIIINPGDKRISKDEFDRIHKRTKLDTGDVVIATCGTIGKCQVIRDKSINYDFSRSVGIIKCDTSELLPDFLYYYLINPHTQNRINKLSEGGVQKHFYIGAMQEFDINVPPIDVQEKIISVLSAIDRKIICNNNINDNLQHQLKLLYDYWFTQFDFPDENGKPYRSSGGAMVWNAELKKDIPKDWIVTTVGEITVCHDSKRIPVSNVEREKMKGNIPYYGATGIMGYVNRAIFSGDYVLLAEDGSVMDKNGNPIIQRVSGDVWINNHAHVLQPTGRYSCRLLMMILKDIPVTNIKTGSIQLKINQKNLNSYKILSIPNDIIEKINQLFNPIDQQLIAIQKETDYLSAVRDWLLPMLMNGQATISD